jgi:hypothetical protein
MSIVLFIENLHSTERHFTHGFRVGAIRAGWTPKVVWLHDPKEKPKTIQILTEEIEQAEPDLIIWLMDSILPFAECLESEKIRNIPKASLWFDDYQRTYALHKYPERHQALLHHSNLNTYIWDGFWREKFQNNFSIPSYPIHLAADEIEIFPGEPTHFKGYDQSIIFVGNTPSLNYIKEVTSILSKPCEKLIHRTQEIISQSKYGRLPYDCLEEAYESLPAKMKVIVDHFQKEIEQKIIINRLAWLLGKREVRLRILRKAVEQRSVLIMSGHSDKSFAKPEEFKRDLGTTKHEVKFIETSHLKAEQLGSLYHVGGLQIQATDPQSVQGGIPFRVFETAASARPLLSDFKPELADCFVPEKEILCFQSDEDFSEKLSDVLKDKVKLEAVGQAAHQRFLKEHTWRHRFEQLSKHLNHAGVSSAIKS